MYYRRKLLLAIIAQFGGELSATKLQKILFLVTRKQAEKSYDFVPYKYGCFSFQANQDLSTLNKKNVLSSQNTPKGVNWKLASSDNYFAMLKKSDQAVIKQVENEAGGWKLDELIRHTYVQFPYYATKSQIADKLLSDQELQKVHSQQHSFDSPAFFTIGYEGISLETYLNKLITNDVKLLCDVRKNALSMKFGFSKNQLKNACENLGILYAHIPQLGITSDKRTNLKTINDYNKLFEQYEQTTLKENYNALEQLSQIAYKHKRVAITCFEREPCMCHRSRVANSLQALPYWDIPQKHL